MQCINLSNNIIFGASDASVKNGNATYAWIISSGQVEDISTPNLNIEGHGIMDGFLNYISLTRAELTGLTAISIIFCLLSDFHSSSATLAVTCDNQGALSKLQTFSARKLHNHHEPNLDLYLTHHSALASSSSMKYN
jgi:ribonuclease HI